MFASVRPIIPHLHRFDIVCDSSNYRVTDFNEAPSSVYRFTAVYPVFNPRCLPGLSNPLFMALLRAIFCKIVLLHKLW